MIFLNCSLLDSFSNKQTNKKLQWVVEEESNSTTCLEFSLFVFCLDLPYQGCPHFNSSPPLTWLTVIQPLRLRHGLIQKAVPNLAQQANLRPCEEFLLFAGCTLCRPPSPHLPHTIMIWVCFLFPKESKLPQDKDQICMPQHASWDLAEYTFPNSFHKIYASER